MNDWRSGGKRGGDISSFVYQSEASRVVRPTFRLKYSQFQPGKAAENRRLNDLEICRAADAVNSLCA